ncbi:MAG: biotin-dependent carboxyltransferase family protein, partial [Cyclobacteriaceae bacterium]
GADLSPKLNKDLIPLNKVIAVKKDDIISFGTPKFGSRCYLAVKGGFQTEFIMNSYAYYGSITNSNTIRKGEKLPIQSVNIASDHFTSIKINSEFFTSQDLECTTGPEYDLLGARDRELIFKTNFTVTKDNNRMGYRLESPPIPYPQAYNMLTSSVLPGTVQLTPSGKLIVLMKDCQTTGGYPRVLQLTGSGINKLAQKKANDIISFQLLT